MDLMQLFYERDQQFTEYTETIYGEISIVLDAICIHLSSFPAYNFRDGVVKWEDVSLYEDNVMIVGLLTYNTGTVIDVEGEKMNITEENATYFQRVIRIGLPAELAIKGTVVSIVHYLQMLHAREELLNRNIVSTPMAGPKISGTLGDEFDLDGLTDEQKRAYKMSVTKGTIN